MTPDGRTFIFVVEKALSDIWLIGQFDPEAARRRP